MDIVTELTTVSGMKFTIKYHQRSKNWILTVDDDMIDKSDNTYFDSFIEALDEVVSYEISIKRITFSRDYIPIKVINKGTTGVISDYRDYVLYFLNNTTVY